MDNRKKSKKQLDDWRALISRIAIFKTIGTEELDFLVSETVSRKHVLEAGEAVIKQGETGDSLFILCDGAVSVLLEQPGSDPVTLYTLTDGEIFGEMALFGQSFRAATLVTTEPTKLLEIQGDDFLILMRNHHEIALHLLAKLSQRLRHTDDLILSQQVSIMDSSVSELKTQLDVIVQTTDAKLAAAQTVFEQTNKRAGEIIDSAGRARTRMTWLATTATTILALVAGAGFINFDAARKEIAHTQRQIEGIKTRIEAIQDTVKTNADSVETAARTAVEAANGAVESANSAKAASVQADESALGIFETAKQIELLRIAIDETSRKASRAYYGIILDSFKEDLPSGQIRTATAEQFVELVSRAPKDYGESVRNFLYKLIVSDDEKQ